MPFFKLFLRTKVVCILFVCSFIHSKEFTFTTEDILLKNFPDIKNLIQSPHDLVPKSNEKIKKELDQLSMVRRETHFTGINSIPYYKTTYNFKNRNRIPNVNFENGITNDNSGNVFRSNDLRILNNGYDYQYHNDAHNVNNRGLIINTYHKENGKFVPKKNFDYEHIDTTDNRNIRDSNILQLFHKQNELVLKLAKTLEIDDVLRKRKNDFEDLLNEIENKKKGTALLSEQHRYTDSTTSQLTTKQTEIPTVITLIDETKVRNALKNDPLVRRILGIARKRRENYAKQAKKYFNME